MAGTLHARTRVTHADRNAESVPTNEVLLNHGAEWFGRR